MEDTAKNYVSSIRHWTNFCAEIDENPLGFPLNPELVMFWIADRAYAANSVASLNTWESSITWLGQIRGFSNRKLAGKFRLSTIT